MSRAKLRAINRARRTRGLIRADIVNNLYSELGSQQAVATRLGISRRTVRGLLQRIHKAEHHFETLDELSEALNGVEIRKRVSKKKEAVITPASQINTVVEPPHRPKLIPISECKPTPEEAELQRQRAFRERQIEDARIASVGIERRVRPLTAEGIQRHQLKQQFGFDPLEATEDF